MYENILFFHNQRLIESYYLIELYSGKVLIVNMSIKDCRKTPARFAITFFCDKSDPPQLRQSFHYIKVGAYFTLFIERAGLFVHHSISTGNW